LSEQSSTNQSSVKQAQIYFLISRAEYQQAMTNGHLVRESLSSEGFLHASPKEQLKRVAEKHYRQVDDLCVMVVECQKVHSEIKWESAAGGLYPHIYGPLNMDSVSELVAFDQFFV